MVETKKTDANFHKFFAIREKKTLIMIHNSKPDGRANKQVRFILFCVVLCTGLLISFSSILSSSPSLRSWL